MSDARTLPSTASVLVTLIGVTWRRLFRGRSLWVSALIALLPVVLAGVMGHRDETLPAVDVVITLVMVLLPPMFIASSLGEEIEDRTTTYLWSRPLARWTIIVGKLAALAPIALALVVGGTFIAVQIAAGRPPKPAYLIATGAGTLVIAAMAAGISTLVPKHGMALSIVYLVVFDLALGAIPASIHRLSITKQVRLIADGQVAEPAITMLILATIWLALAFWRIRKLES